MENKIDIAEMLKDCPRGMELDCAIYDGVTLDSVVFESEYHYEGKSNYPIKIVTKNGFSTRLTKYGQNVDIEEAKCVIFPKGKKTWEGFQRPFKSGDVVFYNDTISIFKEWGDETLFRTYVATYLHCDSFIDVNVPFYGKSVRKEIRLATEKEKEKLFQAIKDSGYEWNEKTKALDEKLTFKDGDILYVDTNDDDEDDDCFKYTFILKVMDGRKVMAHCYMTAEDYFKPIEVYLVDDTYPIRFATEEEKQKLFQTIEDNGYKWNEKTKALEKLIEPTPTFKAGDKIRHKENTNWVCTIRKVEDRYYVVGHPARFTLLFNEQDKYELVPNKFDINTLKTFDQVLVRLSNNCVWMPKLFSHYDTDSKVKYYPFVTLENLGYPQCIPYNGNEHLSRTTDNCDEFYKNW